MLVEAESYKSLMLKFILCSTVIPASCKIKISFLVKEHHFYDHFIVRKRKLINYRLFPSTLLKYLEFIKTQQ